MAMYSLRRLLVLGPQLLFVSLVTFLLVHIPSGNPARLLLGPLVTPESVRDLERAMGLDNSLPEQYWIYILNAARGDLGRSWFTGQAVSADLGDRLPATLELITFAMAVAVCVGLVVGVLPALRGSRGPIFFALNAYLRLAGSFPDFWIALVATYLFFFRLHWFPAPVGRLSVAATPPPKVTGFYTIDSLLDGDLQTFGDAAAHLALPVLVLGLIIAPGLGRIINSALTAVLQSDYMIYTRAAGLTPATSFRYAFRNTLPPVVTMIGVYYVYLLGGAVLIEKIFGWGGVGQYAVDAVANSDYAAIQGFVLIAAIFTVLVYLVVDLVRLVIDPRLTHD